jgi:hypothetical protein
MANEKARNEEIKKKREEENPDRFALVPAAKPMRDPTVDQNFDHIRTYLLHKEGQVKSAYKNLYDRVLRNEKRLYRTDDSAGVVPTSMGSDHFYSHESGLDKTNERIIPQHTLETPVNNILHRKGDEDEYDTVSDSDDEKKEVRRPFIRPKIVKYASGISHLGSDSSSMHISNPLAQPKSSVLEEKDEPIEEAKLTPIQKLNRAGETLEKMKQKMAKSPIEPEPEPEPEPIEPIIQKAHHEKKPITPDLLSKFKYTPTSKRGGVAIKGQTKAETSDEIARMRAILFINKNILKLTEDQIMAMKYSKLKKTI